MVTSNSKRTGGVKFLGGHIARGNKTKVLLVGRWEMIGVGHQQDHCGILHIISWHLQADGFAVRAVDSFWGLVHRLRPHREALVSCQKGII